MQNELFHKTLFQKKDTRLRIQFNGREFAFDSGLNPQYHQKEKKKDITH